MKRLWVVGLIPPLVVTAVAFLIIPGGAFSAGATVGLVFLAGLYFAFFTMPMLAPKSESIRIYSVTYALVVWPCVVAAGAIALLALLVHAISWKWILAADIVVLGLVVTVSLVTTGLTEKDARVNTKAQKSVSDLRRLAFSVENASTTATDPSLKRRAKQVAEQIRLSPFAGVPGSASVEYEIEAAVGAVGSAPDDEALIAALDRVSTLVDQRNRIVKIER